MKRLVRKIIVAAVVTTSAIGTFTLMLVLATAISENHELLQLAIVAAVIVFVMIIAAVGGKTQTEISESSLEPFKSPNHNISQLGALTYFDDDRASEIVELAIAQNNGGISTSWIRKNFGFSYERAAALISDLNEKKIIGTSSGNKPRKILITSERLYDLATGYFDLEDKRGYISGIRRDEI